MPGEPVEGRARHGLRRPAHRQGAAGAASRTSSRPSRAGSPLCTLRSSPSSRWAARPPSSSASSGRRPGCAGIADYQTNGDCAAGTGSFMDQQASRLLYDIEDVGDIVLGAGKAASIAGRCSVFAKSRHDPRAAEGLPAAGGAARASATPSSATSRAPSPRARSSSRRSPSSAAWPPTRAPCRRCARRSASTDGDLFVPELYAWMGAIGAALIEADGARRSRQPAARVDVQRCRRPTSPSPSRSRMDRVLLLRDMAEPYRFAGEGVVDAYLGIDVGSVSTNLVVIDDAGRASSRRSTSRPTRGRSRSSTRRSRHPRRVRRPHPRAAAWAPPAPAASSSASSRGADIITDEITAHKTGADFIGRKIDRQVRHDLRDRRPGLQVHQPAGRHRRRLRHERGLRRRHRLVPRGAGREARHQHHRRVRRAGPQLAGARSAWASAAPCSWSAT